MLVVNLLVEDYQDNLAVVMLVVQLTLLEELELVD